MVVDQETGIVDHLPEPVVLVAVKLMQLTADQVKVHNIKVMEVVQ